MARKPINFAKGREIVRRDKKRQAIEESLARGPERFTDIPKYLFQSSVERVKAQAVTGLLGQSLGSAVLQSRSARPGQRFKEFKSLVIDRTLGSMGIVGDVIRAKSRGRFDDNVTKGNADEKFEAIRNKFLGINDAVKVIDENFNKVNKRIEKLEKNAVELKNLNGLVKSVEDLDKKFTALDSKVDKQFSDFDSKFRLMMREMNQQSERVNVRGMTPRDQVVSGGGTGSGDILNQLLKSLLPSAGTVARGGAAAAAALAAARSAKVKAVTKSVSSVAARTASGAARFAGPLLSGAARFAGPVGAAYAGYETFESLRNLKPVDPNFKTRPTATTPSGVLARMKAAKDPQLNQVGKLYSDLRRKYRAAEADKMFFKVLDQDIQSRYVSPSVQNLKDYGTMGDDIDYGGGIPSSVGNMNLGAKTSTGQRIGVMPSLPMRNFSRGQLDFQSQFLRQQIEQQKSQFLKFGQLPPGFEFVQGNMGRLGSAQAVAARGAMPLMGMPSGGMGMPSYGGRAVSSGMGYGSSSPGYDTGGAQNFGIESQDITIPTSGGKKGMIDRRQFSEELKNPRVKELFFTMMQAEVGSQGKKAQIAFAETVFNRATVEGKSLEGILSNRKYYAPYKNGAFNRARRSMNDSKRNSYAEILGIVQGGSDITKGATHNASAGVAASVKRGGYDSIRNSIIDIGGETYYRKTYEQKRFNARIKRFTEDQPQSGQQQGVNQQIPRTGVNVNQSQASVTAQQPSQASVTAQGTSSGGSASRFRGLKNLEKHRAEVMPDDLVVTKGAPGTPDTIADRSNLTGFINGRQVEQRTIADDFEELRKLREARDKKYRFTGDISKNTSNQKWNREDWLKYDASVGEGGHRIGNATQSVRSVKREDGQQIISPNVGRVVQKQMEVAGIRKRPISNKLEKVLRYASQQSGAEVVIFSGGQRGKHEHGHGKRIGSTRHDYGHAADLDLFVTEGGKRRRLNPRNKQDRQIMQKFIFAAAQAGATGIGHGSGYMGSGRLHVGFGKVATWGGGMESTGFNSAFYEGRKNQIDLNKINLNAPTEEQQSNLQTDRKVVQSQNGHRTHFDQGKETPLQFHTRLYGNIAEVSKTSGFSQNQLAAILGVPSTQKFEQYRARQAEEKRKQQLGRKALGQFTQAEINAARQEVPGPLGGRRPETDQEVRQRLTKAAINKVAVLKQEDQTKTGLGKLDEIIRRPTPDFDITDRNMRLEQLQSEERAAAQRMMVPGVSDAASAQRMPFGRNAFAGEDAQIEAQRQLLEAQRQAEIAGISAMDANILSAQQAQMMDPRYSDFAVSYGTRLANKVAAEEEAMMKGSLVHPLAGMPRGRQFEQYGDIGEAPSSLPSTPQLPKPVGGGGPEAIDPTIDRRQQQQAEEFQSAQKSQDIKLMTGGLDDANVAQKASDAANEVKEKQAKGSTATSKTQKSSSGSGTGGSRGGSGGTNHPESEPASPGSGGYGSYGRCFV